MKIGDIILNESASEINPIRISVFAGVKGRLALCDYVDDGKIKVCKYEISDIEDEVGFKKVGYISEYFKKMAELHNKLVKENMRKRR